MKGGFLSLDHNLHFSHSIGVVGGGQLAQMLAKSAKKLNIDVIVQTGSKADPAVSYSKGLILSPSNNIQGTKDLAKKCTCVTFENEWIDIEGLSSLEQSGVSFIPSLKAIKPLVRKISQRKLLNRLNIPVPKWATLSSLVEDNLKLPDDLQFPLMAKSSFGGYDGKGTTVIKDFSDLKKLLKKVNSKDWYVESWINYKKELSIVVSRDLSGNVRAFPLSETFQHKQVCDWVQTPADVAHPVEVMALNIATSLLRELNYVGVLAIEFFYGDEGLLVNEIAPRTHNSAHFSIDACSTNQFEHQIAISAGMPILYPELLSPGAIMVNLLGFDESNDSITKRMKSLQRLPDLYIHWYEKSKNLPGRKLGHITQLLKSTDKSTRLTEAKKAVQSIRSIWPIQ